MRACSLGTGAWPSASGGGGGGGEGRDGAGGGGGPPPRPGGGRPGEAGAGGPGRLQRRTALVGEPQADLGTGEIFLQLSCDGGPGLFQCETGDGHRPVRTKLDLAVRPDLAYAGHQRGGLVGGFDGPREPAAAL